MNDLTGKTFGRLLVESRIANNKHGHTKWRCICVCGTAAEILGYRLVQGTTVSCGCRRRTVSLRHGKHATAAYRSWNSMRSRCLSESHAHYAQYGGRGIKICEAWLDFECFLRDMGERPFGTSLERIDTDGNYEPSNCRWATMKEQSNNRRDNTLLTHGGVTRTLQQWAEAIGIPSDTLNKRLNKYRWPLDKALTTPKRSWQHHA